MRVIMPAIIDQAGRPFNVDEADAISRRHRRWPPQRNGKSRTRWSSVPIMERDSHRIRGDDQSLGDRTGFGEGQAVDAAPGGGRTRT
jgi:hypothetical protein